MSFRRFISFWVVFSFCLTSLGPYPQAHAQAVGDLPLPGTMINLSPAYRPVIIKGLTVHKDNPFLFDFIVDIGQDKMSGEPLKKEGEKLIKYFLASLAIPDKDVWVNLSPYEKNRMVPEALGQTEMGRDLLEQDYILKQITASLIYPEKKLGKEFWNKVYRKALQMYGTAQVPVNTFNKVWIMADRAEVYEHNQSAFVVDSHLKVMLEEDYLSLSKHQSQPGDMTSVVSPSTSTSTITSNIVRQIILPELEVEVNSGKNFANLRQIFNSIILSSWYKKSLKQALLNQVYANKAKIKGIERPQGELSPEQIYQQYLKAYKKGVFNYIKEEVNAVGTSIPRKYFSGGFAIMGTPAANPARTTDRAMLNSLQDEALVSMTTAFNANKSLLHKDTAMTGVTLPEDEEKALQAVFALADRYNSADSFKPENVNDLGVTFAANYLPRSHYVMNEELLGVYKRKTNGPLEPASDDLTQELKGASFIHNFSIRVIMPNGVKEAYFISKGKDLVVIEKFGTDKDAAMRASINLNDSYWKEFIDIALPADDKDMPVEIKKYRGQLLNAITFKTFLSIMIKIRREMQGAVMNRSAVETYLEKGNFIGNNPHSLEIAEFLNLAIGHLVNQEQFGQIVEIRGKLKGFKTDRDIFKVFLLDADFNILQVLYDLTYPAKNIESPLIGQEVDEDQIGKLQIPEIKFSVLKFRYTPEGKEHIFAVYLNQYEKGYAVPLKVAGPRNYFYLGENGDMARRVFDRVFENAGKRNILFQNEWDLHEGKYVYLFKEALKEIQQEDAAMMVFKGQIKKANNPLVTQEWAAYPKGTWVLGNTSMAKKPWYRKVVLLNVQAGSFDEAKVKGQINSTAPPDTNPELMTPIAEAIANFGDTIAQTRDGSPFPSFEKEIAAVIEEEMKETGLVDQVQQALKDYESQNKNDINLKTEMWTRPLIGKLRPEHIVKVMERLNLQLNPNFIKTAIMMRERLQGDELRVLSKSDPLVFDIATGIPVEFVEAFLDRPQAAGETPREILKKAGLEIGTIFSTHLVFGPAILPGEVIEYYPYLPIIGGTQSNVSVALKLYRGYKDKVGNEYHGYFLTCLSEPPGAGSTETHPVGPVIYLGFDGQKIEYFFKRISRAIELMERSEGPSKKLIEAEEYWIEGQIYYFIRNEVTTYVNSRFNLQARIKAADTYYGLLNDENIEQDVFTSKELMDRHFLPSGAERGELFDSVRLLTECGLLDKIAEGEWKINRVFYDYIVRKVLGIDAAMISVAEKNEKYPLNVRVSEQPDDYYVIECENTKTHAVSAITIHRTEENAKNITDMVNSILSKTRLTPSDINLDTERVWGLIKGLDIPVVKQSLYKTYKWVLPLALITMLTVIAANKAFLFLPSSWHSKVLKIRKSIHLNQTTNGGIDLSTSGGMQWKVSRDGNGIEMDIDPAMIARIQHQGIDWLSPVILKMLPVKSIWLLEGLQASAS